MKVSSIASQVIKTPEQREQFRQLYNEYRHTKNPYKKMHNLGKQVCLWNEVKWQQKNSEAAFHCGAKTGRKALIGRLESKLYLPVLSEIGKTFEFFAKIADKVNMFRARHNF